MKQTLVLIIALVLCFAAKAQQATQPVDKGTLHPVSGVGSSGYERYTFAASDKVHMHYKATKELERAIAITGKTNVLARVKGGKEGDLDFTMPDRGVVTFQWVTDRGGATAIDYEVTRTPASAETLHFNTTVTSDAAPAE